MSGVLQTAEIIADLFVRDSDYLRGGGDVRLAAVANDIANSTGNWKYIQSVGFIDAGGSLVRGVARSKDGVFQPVQPADLSKTESYNAHFRLTKATDRTFLSKMVPGFATGEPIVIVSKGFWDESGTFLGVAKVAVHRDAFASRFEGLLTEVGGAINMFRRDGTLLLTVPTMQMEVGKSYASSRLFTTKLDHAPAGSYLSAVMGGGVERQLAYRAGDVYPFVVVVGLPLPELLADWRRTSITNASAAAFGAVVIMLLAFGLAMWVKRQIALQSDLVRSEQSFAESQRISGLGHFRRIHGERHYEWSDNMYVIHGVDRATYRPTMESIVELFIPEDRQIFDNAATTNFARPSAGFMEGRIRRPDGEERHMRYEWRLVVDVDGARVFGVAQDLTLLRKAEAGQRENELRLADILQCSSDYIWETDPGGVFTVFSGASVDLFHSPLRLDGSTFYLRSHDPNDLADLEQALTYRRQFRNLVVAARGAGGGNRWVRVSGNPRFDDHGRFLGYRGAGTDVTEQRRQREQLEAQRKGEALGRLASGLAHEINKLLQPVLIYSAAGQAANQANAEIRSYFNRIFRSAEQAGSIVRNVLAFARRGPPKRDDVKLLDVVHETVELTGIGDAPELSIVLDAPSLDVVVRVDRTGLSQAMLNLLTNASEAMKRQGKISVSAEQVAIAAPGDAAASLKPGIYCRLRISDSGPGIAAENLNRLFDPFFTTKPQGEGTGLGLSVVSGLVKSWGGGVTAANDSAGGAVFMVYLPLAVAQAEAAQ